MFKNSNSKRLIKLSSFITFIFFYAVFVTGSTYAFMNYSVSNSSATGTGGCFEVTYTGQDLNAGNIMSTVDYLNGAHTTVTLSKDSSCKIYTEANIYLHTNNETTAPIEEYPALRYKIISNSFEKNGIVKNKDDYLLLTVPLTDTATTYTIYLWVDSDLSAGNYHGTTYSGYIYAESSQTSTIPGATFLDGKSFNAKIKQLAGNSSATYATENTNIKSIQRSNTLSIQPTSTNLISVSNSQTPVYAWFTNDTIYYYAGAATIYLNSDASYMFTELLGAESIDLKEIDSSNTTTMESMFEDCNSRIIDLNSFDTSNVTNMQSMFNGVNDLTSGITEIRFGRKFNTANVTNMSYMFSDCVNLTEIDLANFNTSKVTNMSYMFYRNNSVKKLDIGKFNMSKVTKTTNMLGSMTSIEKIKTPSVYPSSTSVTISLPKTFYDNSNNSYSQLNSSSPTQTWLGIN